MQQEGGFHKGSRPDIDDPMTARRRRTNSDSEQVPLLGGDTASSSSVSAAPLATFSNSSSSRIVPEAGTFAAMTSRDRTNEFMGTVRSLQGRQAVAIESWKQGRRDSRALQQYGSFMHTARSIGKNIARTYTKLEKLALLAKKKSLFDDKGVEIQELTYMIKEDLGSLNKQIGDLGSLARTSSSSQLNSKGSHLQRHSSGVVVGLQSRLASMSTEFQAVLEVRSDNLKKQKSRQQRFGQQGGLPAPNSLPPSALTGFHQGSVLLAQDQDYSSASSSSSGQVAIDMDNRGGMGQERQQQMQMYDETDSYLQSRVETMQNIESTIVELSGIFQQLAHMVKEQEEIVQRIDSNVEDTELNVEAAHGEILKYFRSVTSNRWLMLKVFAVLIFFFILFVVFLA